MCQSFTLGSLSCLHFTDFSMQLSFNCSHTLLYSFQLYIPIAVFIILQLISFSHSHLLIHWIQVMHVHLIYKHSIMGCIKHCAHYWDYWYHYMFACNTRMIVLFYRCSDFSLIVHRCCYLNILHTITGALMPLYTNRSRFEGTNVNTMKSLHVNTCRLYRSLWLLKVSVLQSVSINYTSVHNRG